MASDHSLTSDVELPQTDRHCLCCATHEPPAVTLTTEFVQYLRCPTCGFIWTIRAPLPEGEILPLSSTD